MSDQTEQTPARTRLLGHRGNGSAGARPMVPGVQVGAAPLPEAQERLEFRRVALLCVLLLALLGTTALAATLLWLREGRALRDATVRESVLLSHAIEAEVEAHVEWLESLRMQFRSRELARPQMLRSEVADEMAKEPGVRCVASFDDDRPGWTWIVAGPELLDQLGIKGTASERGPGMDFVYWQAPQVLSMLAERTLSAGSAVAMTVDPLPGEEQFLLGAGVPLGQRRPLVALFEIQPELRAQARQTVQRGFHLRLHDDNSSLLLGSGPDGGRGTRYSALENVEVGSQRWPLTVWPSESMIHSRIDAPMLLLVGGGILVSLAATGAVWRVLRYRSREIAATRSHLAALQSLHEVAMAISGKLGARREVLDQLAESALRLLKLRRAGIGLLDETGAYLDMNAFAGDVPEGVPTRFTVADMAASRICFETGLVASIDDLSHPLVQANPALVRAFQIASVILIPLRVEGKNMGLMALADTSPRHFTDGDRRLAALLGAQASVILANNSLYLKVRDALEQEQRLLEQTQRLNAVNAAVYQAATLEESIRTIAEQGPEALGADTVLVDLLEDDGKKMRVAAATGIFAAAIEGLSVPIAGTNAERVIRSGQLLVVEDADRDESIHPLFRERLKIRSQILAPLLRPDGSPIGMIALIYHRPMSLPPAQQDLVRGFATRAAAALENAMLHEQTRRDAEAKAVLLRELHHRVKNNLAGIVGLLSVNEPEDLSDRSRQWLERVADRIRTMARAHELFAQGMNDVSLAELVDGVVTSLSVVKPSEVRVRTELGEARRRVRLETPQAVSLAMVLHELCTNALVHGLAGQVAHDEEDPLRIRAAASENETTVEVIDAGRGMPDLARYSNAPPRFAAVGASERPASAVAVAPEPGVGLKLVSELVRRELRGTFRLGERPGGGTVATITLPISPGIVPDSEQQRC